MQCIGGGGWGLNTWSAGLAVGSGAEGACIARLPTGCGRKLRGGAGASGAPTNPEIVELGFPGALLLLQPRARMQASAAKTEGAPDRQYSASLRNSASPAPGFSQTVGAHALKAVPKNAAVTVRCMAALHLENSVASEQSARLPGGFADTAPVTRRAHRRRGCNRRRVVPLRSSPWPRRRARLLRAVSSHRSALPRRAGFGRARHPRRSRAFNRPPPATGAVFRGSCLGLPPEFFRTTSRKFLRDDPP